MPVARPTDIDVSDIELTDAGGAVCALGDLRDVTLLVLMRHRH